MRALEDLLGSVYDSKSREHLSEATRAYEAGAFKASIVSLWVAVAVDLMAKVRHLADQGDPAAVQHIQSLDTAIQARNKPALMAHERDLLDKCRDAYEFIDARDHDMLTRLQDDRHICAHPAFVSPEVVFEPTAELVRAHAATVVDAVLRHGPTPGRKAVERFTTEISGNAWPSRTEDLREYLRQRYFSRGRDVVRRNLAKVIVKGCLKPPGDDFKLWKRLRKSALLLDQIEPSLLADALDAVVGHGEKATGLPDVQILRFIGAFGELKPAWAVLPTTSMPRFDTLVRNAGLEDLILWAVLSATTPVPAVESAIEERLNALEVEELARVVATRPAAKHLELALIKLENAANFRTAEYRMEHLVLPLVGFVGVAELQQVRKILASNSQVRMAGDMPPLLAKLYDATHAGAGAQTEWGNIVSDLQASAPDGDLEHYYAYPQLRDKVRGTGIA